MEYEEPIDYSNSHYMEEYQEICLSTGLVTEEQVNDPEFLQQELISQISAAIIACDELQKRLEKLIDATPQMNFDNGLESKNEFMEITKQKLEYAHGINNLMIILDDVCDKSDIFWHNSSVEVYKNNVDFFKLHYFGKNKQAIESDFYVHEYIYYSNDVKKGSNMNILDVDTLKWFDYDKYLTPENREYFRLKRQRILDFLATVIDFMGYQILVTKKGKLIFTQKPKVEESPVDDKPLEISNLPSFNLEQRYEIIRRLGIDNLVMTLDSPKKSKDMLLALIMGSSVDNAKKLLNNDYKKFGDSDKNDAKSLEIKRDIEDFFERNKVKIKK